MDLRFKGKVKVVDINLNVIFILWFLELRGQIKLIKERLKMEERKEFRIESFLIF